MTSQELIDGEPKFLYSFSFWPDETWGFRRAMFQAFEAMGSRVEMSFSQPEFERFRSDLSSHGITLREIERVPDIDPEIIH